MALEVRMLGSEDAPVLARVAEDVFDGPIDERWLAEFLTDPRHHLAVALDGTLVVGFASGVHTVHPDKPPELWVSEVGVAASHRRLGLARSLLTELFTRACELGCRRAWVATERSNDAARRLYGAVGGVEDAEESVVVTFALEPAGGGGSAGPGHG